MKADFVSGVDIYIRRTIVSDETFGAVWTARGADIAAMEYEPMVRVREQF